MGEKIEKNNIVYFQKTDSVYVYLDTNILILGPKRKEHKILKEKSQKGEIILCISDINKIEQHGKVFPLLYKKDSTLRLYSSLSPMINKNIIKLVNDSDTNYEQAKKEENIEKSYWGDIRLFPIKSRFSSYFLLGGIDQTFNLEIQNEINQLEELISKYRIGGADAVHIMQAFCANINFFLTWDEPLIKKVKKINWITFETLTPKEFLEKNSKK